MIIKKYKLTAAFIAASLTLGVFSIAANAESINNNTIKIVKLDLSDKNISKAIKDEILLQRGVYSDSVDITTNKGIVTLKGVVNNILERERAEQIATSIRGVLAVNNLIRVQPEYVPDNTIRKNIQDSLLLDPATDSYEISVNVDNGHVTLDGEVQSWQEKRLSENIAKGVKGVKSLSNNIDINYVSERTDSEIKNDIQESLKWDIRVNDSLVNVNVKDGIVYLNGTVGSSIEYNNAISNAWVNGVNDVNSTGLLVNPNIVDKKLIRNKYVTRNDSEIKEAIVDSFVYDPRVSYFNIDVNVENGKAILTGSVNNLKAKRTAELNAKSIVGVEQVENRIMVNSGDNNSDIKISEKISDALLMDPYTEKHEIDVNVIDGETILTGTVDSFFEKMRAEDVTSKIAGVTKIVNDLQVEKIGETNAYYYYVEPYDWVLLSPYSEVSEEEEQIIKKSDKEIKENIESQFWWSPFVSENEITVHVLNGHVTLTGIVDSVSEKRAATRNAFEGGAVTVKNNLKVDYREIF